jgi:hypothetical protein
VVNEVRKIIRQEIENLFEDFRYRYDGSFYPNESMIKSCLEALNAVEENDLTKNVSKKNEGSGKSKAKIIVNKEPLNHSQLKRMKAFFDNNESEASLEKSKGENVYTSGLLQIWNLWGGDAGKSWCNTHISQRNSSNDTSKTIRGASGIRSKNLMNPLNTRIHR